MQPTRFAFVFLVTVGLPAQRILATVTGAAPQDWLGTAVAWIGDLDGDGTPDFAAATAPRSSGVPEYLHLCSGRDGRVLRTLLATRLVEDWGAAVAPIADLDGDQVADILVGAPIRQIGSSLGAVDIYSGRTGALLRTVNDDSGDISRLGQRVLGWNDLDGDGAPDFIATAPGRGTVRAYSGRTGLRLRTIQFGSHDNPNTTSIASAGDVNGDGAADLLVGEPQWGNGSTGQGRVAVYDLATGSRLWVVETLGTATPALGAAVAGIGDVDGDAIPDLAVGAPSEVNPAGVPTGAVHFLAGRTGQRFRTVFSPPGGLSFGAALSAAGDVNGDGVPDVAVGSPHASPAGAFAFLSGSTGAILLWMEGARPASFGFALDASRDADGDGLRDVVVANPSETIDRVLQGAVRVVSGRILATATPVGQPCGGGPLLPRLGGTPPVVGTLADVVGNDAPSAPGALIISEPPVAPFDLVPPCRLFVTLPGMVLGPVGGVQHWKVSFFVPVLPGLVGYELAFQVAYAPTSGPMGLDLTNGLRWRIGS
jgi:hypothetical protein